MGGVHPLVDTLAKAIENSTIVVTVRDEHGELIGLARGLSDDAAIFLQDILVRGPARTAAAGWTWSRSPAFSMWIPDAGTVDVLGMTTCEQLGGRRWSTVALRHLAYSSAEACVADLEGICARREVDGERVDFLDATAFAPDELYLTVGTFTDFAPYASDYTGSAIYYRSIRERERDYLTVGDYLWRWDTDWFWCSRAFGAQNPLITGKPTTSSEPSSTWRSPRTRSIAGSGTRSATSTA
jgi:hypothetical protein